MSTCRWSLLKGVHLDTGAEKEKGSQGEIIYMLFFCSQNEYEVGVCSLRYGTSFKTNGKREQLQRPCTGLAWGERIGEVHGPPHLLAMPWIS